ncbi:MAG: hypothetical protein JST00_03570 [Deltaproteobacteria bacterium]|nr:hypothetical protein [Deltaproteobacteria bacterium]
MLVRANRPLFATVFVALGLLVVGAPVVVAVHLGFDVWDTWPFFVVALALIAGGVSFALDRSPRTGRAFVKASAPSDVPADEPVQGRIAPSPYRGMGATTHGLVAAARRAVHPPVSATATVIVVLACCAFTALAVPALLHLPRWIEIEVVLAAWWAVWATVLGVLAYRGRPLDRDYSLTAPTASPDPASAAAPVTLERPARWRWLDGLSAISDGEGILLVLIGVVVFVVTVVATTLVVDVALPLLFVTAFTGVQMALSRSLAASHRGRLLQSALHGALWATLYMAPLAAATGVVHAVLAR